MMARLSGSTLLLVALGAASCRSPMAVSEAVTNGAAVRRADCIAVLPFANHTDNKSAGAVVAQQMASALTTSEHYNVISPEEATELLRLFDSPATPNDELSQARRAGEVLGVKAVLTGAVTAFDKRQLSRRLPSEESVVAFSARLVDTETGDVVWTSAASHFDYPRALAIASPRESILRQAVGESTRGLVEARPDSIGTRGLCATAYGKLDKKEPTKLAALDPSPKPQDKPTSLAPWGTASPAKLESKPAAKPAAPLPVEPALSSLPALPALDGGAAKPSDGKLSASEPALPDFGAMPALPDIPAGGDALPALPGIPSDGGLPALPGGDALPALPGVPGGDAFPAMPGDAMPALPSLDGGGLPPLGDLPALDGGLPALPGAGGVSSPGAPPSKLLSSLKGAAKGIAKQLYGKKPVKVPSALPKKASAKPAVVGKTKKSLDDLASVLKAAPGLNVRLEVHLDLKGKGATPDASRSLSIAQAAAMADYLRSKHKLGPERVAAMGYGSARRVGKPGAATNNRVEVVVTAYP